MTEETTVTDDFLGQIPRKPRLALMGEFSAGKSTLSKLFLGDDPLPIKITATRLPPVVISHGDSAAYTVGHDGTETRILIEEIEQVQLEETRMIRLFNPSDTLEICDLIDMPGISDPSMSSDVWMSVMDEVDCVVWCTQATQAWRQSEAATWEQIADRTNGQNILLLTQVDKFHSERDLERVMTRLHKETEGLFQNVFPISLTQAIAAGEDEAKWEASGAADFVNDLVERLMNAAATTSADTGLRQPESSLRGTAEPPADAPMLQDDFYADADTEPSSESDAVSVMPKRVRVRTQMRGRTERPSKASVASG